MPDITYGDYYTSYHFRRWTPKYFTFFPLFLKTFNFLWVIKPALRILRRHQNILKLLGSSKTIFNTTVTLLVCVYSKVLLYFSLCHMLMYFHVLELKKARTFFSILLTAMSLPSQDLTTSPWKSRTIEHFDPSTELVTLRRLKIMTFTF